jgi:hypothetical protein
MPSLLPSSLHLSLSQPDSLYMPIWLSFPTGTNHLLALQKIPKHSYTHILLSKSVPTQIQTIWFKSVPTHIFYCPKGSKAFLHTYFIVQKAQKRSYTHVYYMVQKHYKHNTDYFCPKAFLFKYDLLYKSFPTYIHILLPKSIPTHMYNIKFKAF